ncbi:putative cysteine protease [Hibiscus syriacus]|uniref:Cysteine protease n=1 Tax=Hibiscus syriacus TaxID=106335 RepID=A0A6A3BEN0_HIBSY|nr:putative cysteine protease [Hibiscus syriacus]
MWIVQQKKVEHEMISKLVSYDTEINRFEEKKVIKKLKGVKAKEPMLWAPVNEVMVDDKQPGKIHFKCLAGITKTFPVDPFQMRSSSIVFCMTMQQVLLMIMEMERKRSLVVSIALKGYFHFYSNA